MNLLPFALPAVPFAAAVAGRLTASRGNRFAAAVALVAVAAATALAAALLAAAARGSRLGGGPGISLAPFGRLHVSLVSRMDTTAAVVAVMVAVVALCVQLYSVSYLAGDPRYPVYAAEVSLFTAAMLLVVVAGDLVVLLVGWEVMGLCSYLLIGHYRDLPEAPGAAVKAFLVTRVGDVGFLLGVALLGVSAGSFRISDLLARAGQLPSGTVLAATLLLLLGVVGKSAQFPLHTWLPDAMAGPTPISALIHAATMVAAGVYVVARLFPLFRAAPLSLAVLAVVASVTMLFGGLVALVQDDLKRVLAWSTVSQLAYMFGGLAVGSVSAGLFHLLTHAAFKALLFLAAGAVLHATGSGSLARLGGLRRRMPLTFWSMTVGFAALAGIPPLSGFWSKDAVLAAAAAAAATGSAAVPAWSGWLVLVAGVATVGLTAAYAARAWLLAFFGAPGDAAAAGTHGPPRDPPPLMAAPLVLLAVPAVVLGAGVPETGPRLPLVLALLVPALAAVGVGASWLAWRRTAGRDPALLLGVLARPLSSGFWLDDVQRALVVRPVRRVARAVRRLDESGVDGVVEGSGRGSVFLGGRLIRLQTGNVQGYLGGVLGAALVLAVVAVLS